MGKAGVRDPGPRESGRERGEPERRDTSRVDAAARGEPPSEPRERSKSPRPADPAKRALDVVLSVLGLLATSPAWVLLPLLIKLEDGGPVLHAQERVGKGGERFTSFKFRSMEPRPDRDGPPGQAGRERDRVTRVGAFMRPRALDEIPQLLNVLKGDMSLVGPRALLPEEVEAGSEDGEPVRLEELPGYVERHSVRPGLTGLAQTSAPRDLPHEEKFSHDVRYVRNRSLWLDLRLIVRSVAISLLGAWPGIGDEERGED